MSAMSTSRPRTSFVSSPASLPASVAAAMAMTDGSSRLNLSATSPGGGASAGSDTSVSLSPLDVSRSSSQHRPRTPVGGTLSTSPLRSTLSSAPVRSTSPVSPSGISAGPTGSPKELQGSVYRGTSPIATMLVVSPVGDSSSVQAMGTGRTSPLTVPGTAGMRSSSPSRPTSPLLQVGQRAASLSPAGSARSGAASPSLGPYPSEEDDETEAALQLAGPSGLPRESLAMQILVPEKARRTMDRSQRMVEAGEVMLGRDLTPAEQLVMNQQSALHGFETDEKECITKRFVHFAPGKDITAQLDSSGFRQALRPFLSGVTAVDAIFKAQTVRRGRTGVDFAVYCTVACTLLKATFEDKVKLLYKLWDVNGDGILDGSEITRMLRTVSVGADDGDHKVEAIVRRVLDGAPGCTFELFAKAVRRVPELSELMHHSFGGFV